MVYYDSCNYLEYSDIFQLLPPLLDIMHKYFDKGIEKRLLTMAIF